MIFSISAHKPKPNPQFDHIAVTKPAIRHYQLVDLVPSCSQLFFWLDCGSQIVPNGPFWFPNLWYKYLQTRNFFTDSEFLPVQVHTPLPFHVVVQYTSYNTCFNGLGETGVQNFQNKNDRLGRFKNRNWARKKNMNSWGRDLQVGNVEWRV